MGAPRTPTSTVSIPTWWLYGLVACVLAPWLVVGFVYFSPDGGPQTNDVQDGVAAGSSREAGRGPWGRLSLTPIIISPPLEYVPADWGRLAPAEWVFPGASADVVRAFLQSVGFSPELLAQLAPAIREDARIRGVVVTPPPAVVRALSPTVRAQLYTKLAESPLNFDQAQSFRFIGGSPTDWFAGSPISPATRRLVEPLVYRDGAFVHFADIESIRSDVGSEAELRALGKTLLRNSTVLVRLAVDASEDVAGLVDYWGIGGRRTDIRPLLESVASASDDHRVDIVHLLPAFARNHLYRYPKVQTVDMTRPGLSNCLWSSLNFFKDQPDPRYLDVNVALAALRTDYYVVHDNYQLGDIVALVNDAGDLIHVAVHLADGLLFTKNGTSPVAPWTIMSIDHLKDFYRRQVSDPRLIYHRLNAY